MDWQNFFRELEDGSVQTCYYRNNTGLTIEKLYQAFKARIMDELVIPLQTRKDDES